MGVGLCRGSGIKWVTCSSKDVLFVCVFLWGHQLAYINQYDLDATI